MAEIVLPHTFVDGPGNVASGEQVMDQLLAILAQVNGGLDTTNLAVNAVGTAEIADLAVATGKLADLAVTAAKLAAALKPSGTAAAGDEALRALGATASTACAGNDPRLADQRVPTDGSVSTAKIVDLNVTTAKLADGSVNTSKLAVNAVQGSNILNEVVTLAKIASGNAGLGFGAFSVFRNGGVSYVNDSVVVFDTEVIDNGNYYDTATGRFTPAAGYWRLGWCVGSNSPLASDSYWHSVLRKNGTAHKDGSIYTQRGAIAVAGSCGTALVAANGTTDYFDVLIRHNHGSAVTVGGRPESVYFQGEYVGAL